MSVVLLLPVILQTLCLLITPLFSCLLIQEREKAFLNSVCLRMCEGIHKLVWWMWGYVFVCVCMSVLPSKMIIYLQMPPTKSHDPLLWKLDEREVKRQRETGWKKGRNRDVLMPALQNEKTSPLSYHLALQPSTDPKASTTPLADIIPVWRCCQPLGWAGCEARLVAWRGSIQMGYRVCQPSQCGV